MTESPGLEQHLEGLHQTCQTLRGLLATRGEPLAPGPRGQDAGPPRA
jgi:hypothetical protein